MRRQPALTTDDVARLAAVLSGFALTASAVLAADLAREHMARLGALCGAAPHPHCGWCYAAAALALAGLAAFAAALRPAPARRRERRGPAAGAAQRTRA